MPAAAAWRRWPSCHTAGRSCPATSQSDWTDCLTCCWPRSTAARCSATSRCPSVAAADRLPYLLVFAHQWDALLSAYQDLDGGRVIEVLIGGQQRIPLV